MSNFSWWLAFFETLQLVQIVKSQLEMHPNKNLWPKLKTKNEEEADNENKNLKNLKIPQ